MNPEEFKDQFFESALSKYKAHWHKEGKRDAEPVDLWLQYNKDSLVGQEWIHDLCDNYEDWVGCLGGDDYYDEFFVWINKVVNSYMDELERYIDMKMRDYADDQLYYENPEKYYGYPPK